MGFKWSEDKIWFKIPYRQQSILFYIVHVYMYFYIHCTRPWNLVYATCITLSHLIHSRKRCVNCKKYMTKSKGWGEWKWLLIAFLVLRGHRYGTPIQRQGQTPGTQMLATPICILTDHVYYIKSCIHCIKPCSLHLIMYLIPSVLNHAHCINSCTPYWNTFIVLNNSYCIKSCTLYQNTYCTRLNPVSVHFIHVHCIKSYTMY